MNFRLRRFIETTFPMIIAYGLTLVIITNVFGFKWGLVVIGMYSIVDVVMLRKGEVKQ